MNLSNCDCIASAITRFDVTSHCISLDSFTNQEILPFDDTITFLGMVPDSSYLARLQSKIYYSQFVSNIFSLFKDWDFKKGAADIIGEHPIFHPNLRGVGHNLFNGTYFNTPKAYYDSPIIGFFPRCYVNLDGDFISGLGVITSHDNADIDAGVGDLILLLPSLISSINNGSYDTHDSSTSISLGRASFTVNESLNRVAISYSIQADQIGTPGSNNSYRAIWQVLHEFIFIRNEDFSLTESLNLDINNLWSMRSVTYSVSHLLTVYDLMYTPEMDTLSTLNPLSDSEMHSYYEWLNQTDHSVGFANNFRYILPETVSDLTGTDQNGSVIHIGVRSLPHFRGVALSLLNDSFSGNFLSSKEAIDKELQQLEANHLETLSEVADLGGMVSVLKVIKYIGNFKRRPVPAILQILSVVSDATLTYSFGLAPTVASCNELADKAKPLLAKLSSLSTPRSANGKFTYAIPDEFVSEFPGTRLVCRSKIRYSVNPDSYLSALLPIKSLGLLPTLSSLWDLVPFSFLIDQILHVGSNQDDVESVVSILAMNIHFSVNSMCFTYKFTEDDCIVAGIIPDTSVEHDNADDTCPRYSVYCRYVLDTIPVMGPTRFRFHGEVSLPDWITSSALLYKFIS
jgi:hypothetical protein